MLDNILNSVKRGADRLQRRGEEAAQIARLKVEIFQLSREQDALYARLGRSVYSGAEVDVLQDVRQDISRVEEEIKARERLITELSTAAETAEAEVKQTVVSSTPVVTIEKTAAPKSNEGTSDTAEVKE